MKRVRALVASLSIATAMLVAIPSAAVQRYLLTGKFANSQGHAIDIPVIGDNPGGARNCGSTTMGAGMVMVPGMSPIFQGFRSTLKSTGLPTPPIAMTMFANNRGCLSLMGAVNATGPGVGKAFTFPVQAINHPLPGMTVAVSIPHLPNAIQFATSFQFTGPPPNLGTGSPPMSPGENMPNGTMNNGLNTAMFRYFHKSAWLSQTGRAGAMFTWCFGNPNCTKVTQAKGYPNAADPVHQLIVKYTPGPNRFGGTMTHVINSGPNRSSVAVSAGFAAQFLGLAGSMGQMRTGRGYADYGTDPLMGGMAFATFKVGKVFVPALMSSQNLITRLGPSVPGSGGSNTTVTVNKNFGFPFTTGTVLARNTGRDVQNNPVVITLTGMGGDAVTAMGARNISLVAGALAGIDLLSSETPGLNQMFLPEPGAPAQLIAGAVVLLAIAAWRARVA